jgi:CRP-like cAMP-binding protein
MPALPPASHFASLVERGRWFSLLPAECRAPLLAAAQVRRFDAGQALFRQGDANAGLYCLVAGSVRVGTPPQPEREMLLSVLEPPQWFGEIACLDGGPRTHDAIARTASTLLLVPLPELERLAADDPRWWRFLGQLLAEKVRALFSGLEELSGLPAPARVARRLLAMAQGHGMLAPGLTHRMVGVNQQQLGAMLSLTRQTVSEVLREFEARGWAKRHYGAIELLDWAALERVGAEQRER